MKFGFPSASDTEYEILRTLIEGNYIPDDVTVQVLVQARAELIKKLLKPLKALKRYYTFYNSTSTLQRKVVFKKDMDGIVDIAVEAHALSAN